MNTASFRCSVRIRGGIPRDLEGRGGDNIYNQPSFIIYVIYSPICIILLDNTRTTFILYNISVAQYKKLKCKKCQDSGDLISRIDTEVTVGALPP